MGPNLICDKSILQSLSPAELNVLRRYYSLNVPPVLCLEIRADLAKGEDFAKSRRAVQALATKLVPICVTVNVPFRDLILGELRGQEIGMKGVPVLPRGEYVTSANGKKGFISEQSETEKTLLRWQVNDFDAAEHILAHAWRQSTAANDLDAWRRKLQTQYSGTINLRSVKEVADFVDGFMRSANPAILFSWFLNECAYPPQTQGEAMGNLLVSDAKEYLTLFPYASFCMRAALIFHFALAFGLVSTKSNTPVDFEYLYYLPFCKAFSSGDKFHRVMARHLLRDDQSFVWSDDLREDLKRLCAWLSTLNEQEEVAERERSHPPENEDSVTHRLWRKHLPQSYVVRSKTPVALDSVAGGMLFKDTVRLVNDAKPNGEKPPDSVNDVDFVVFKHTVYPDAPCFCGSNLTYENCHGKGN